MRRPRSVYEHIADIDRRLKLNAARLAKYRVFGSENDVIVQQGVIDRLLDARLLFMADRDRH